MGGGARMRTGGAMATVGQDENPDEKTGLFPPECMTKEVGTQLAKHTDFGFLKLCLKKDLIYTA